MNFFLNARYCLKLLLLLVSSVCKVKGMLSLQKSRIGEALCWAIRGQDSAFATHLGDIFLKDYIKSGSFACPDILDNLGSIVLTCDRFMFIGKYQILLFFFLLIFFFVDILSYK